MRLLITLFILAVAQLFFNVAEAAPRSAINVSHHKATRKNVTEDMRRKRRPVKATSSRHKTRQPLSHRVKALASHRKLREHPAREEQHRTAEHHRIEKKVYGRHRPVARKSNARPSEKLTAIRMSSTHRMRYQKARQTAMVKLMDQLGKPYQWGGSSPHTGFDCSGLVYYAYKDLVNYRIPRTANEMFHLRDAAPIKRNQLEKGDLVFFHIHGREKADHVGVYLGNGKFIQSPRTGKDIQISALSNEYWQSHYIGARRVMTPTTVR
ncbi:C40 family peptidase [Tatumella terrea]|uniref:C40 family peptidase n=1 Tax=Tatumella TaxID=82986 RepID=UPI001BB0B91F|nr:C40 family peptidase [Tatumella sp. JGM118]MBS0908211.1 C40 family peptidase [Tatumella sp. JGM118]